MTKQKKKNKRMPKSQRKLKPEVAPKRDVTFHGSVLQSIRQHARSSPEAEICGALIGRQSQTATTVTGAIVGEGADQGGAHVTFTQQAWVHIHKEKDRKYSGQAIVGWYHSHPGFGVFLSDHDLFIHKNFFTDPGSIAWVFDPHSDEEGCFGWNGGEVRLLEQYGVVTDLREDKSPKIEPARLMPGHVASSENCQNLPTWLSSRYAQVLIVAVVVILVALLVSLGLQLHKQPPVPNSPTKSPVEQANPSVIVDVNGPSEKGLESTNSQPANQPSEDNNSVLNSSEQAPDGEGRGDER